MKYKVGFIGCGNMAKAIAKGIVASKQVKAKEIIGADIDEGQRKGFAEACGAEVCADNAAVAKGAEIIFLAVKPQFLADAVGQIREHVGKDQIIVSIAAGVSLYKIMDMFGGGGKLKVVRLMPNTPALVNAGMTAMCANENVTKAEQAKVMKLIKAFGDAEVVPEKLFDTVTAVSGSSPAYVFMFIEAMADAAVAGGMPRDAAYRFAAKAVEGSARLMLDTGKHPGELKDMVCSPAGTTIEAVRVLEECGFRSAVIEAMEACREKSMELG